MYTKSKLISMNFDRNYSSGGWIMNINDLNDNKLYSLYATKDSSLGSGRKYVALPADKILNNDDYLKYNIIKESNK